MLTNWSLKLCPLLAFAFATFGCGKKMSEPDSKASNQTQNQERPAAYVLRLESAKQQYVIPQDTNFEFPQYLIVRSGSGAGKTIEVLYNVDPGHDDDYEHKCHYVGTADPNIMTITECWDAWGGSYGNASGQDFFLKENQIIQIQFVGNPADKPVVDIIYEMRWF